MAEEYNPYLSKYAAIRESLGTPLEPIEDRSQRILPIPEDTTFLEPEKDRWGTPSDKGEFRTLPPYIGGQYTGDPTQPGMLFKQPRMIPTDLKRQARQGLASAWYEVDHIIPLALGGTNEQSNLAVLHTDDHDNKTKVGAVVQELYFNGKMDKMEAVQTVLNWKKFNTDGIVINDKGRMDLAAAENIFANWEKPKKITAWDVVKGMPEALKKTAGEWVGKIMPETPIGEFGKGFAEQMTLGWMQVPREEYETEKAQLIADISRGAGNVAGFFLPFAAWAKVAGKVATVGLGAKALRGTALGNWYAGLKAIGFMRSKGMLAAPLVKGGKYVMKGGKYVFAGNKGLRALQSAGLLSTYGLLTRHEENTFANYTERFFSDMALGGVIGAAGHGVKGYAGVGVGTYAISALEGAEVGEALTNTAMMVGLHGIGHFGASQRMKQMQYQVIKISAATRAKWGFNKVKYFGNTKEVQRQANVEIEQARRIMYDTIVAPTGGSGTSYAILREEMEKFIIATKQIYKGGLARESKLMEDWADLVSIFNSKKNKAMTSNAAESKYMADSSLKGIDASTLPAGQEMRMPEGEVVFTSTKRNLNSRHGENIDAIIERGIGVGDEVTIAKVRNPDAEAIRKYQERLPINQRDPSPEKVVTASVTVDGKTYEVAVGPTRNKTGRVDERGPTDYANTINERLRQTKLNDRQIDPRLGDKNNIYDSMGENNYAIGRIVAIGEGKGSGEPYIRIAFDKTTNQQGTVYNRIMEKLRLQDEGVSRFNIRKQIIEMNDALGIPRQGGKTAQESVYSVIPKGEGDYMFVAIQGWEEQLMNSTPKQFYEQSFKRLFKPEQISKWETERPGRTKDIIGDIKDGKLEVRDIVDAVKVAKRSDGLSPLGEELYNLSIANGPYAHLDMRSKRFIDTLKLKKSNPVDVSQVKQPKAPGEISQKYSKTEATAPELTMKKLAEMNKQMKAYKKGAEPEAKKEASKELTIEDIKRMNKIYPGKKAPVKEYTPQELLKMDGKNAAGLDSNQFQRWTSLHGQTSITNRAELKAAQEVSTALLKRGDTLGAKGHADRLTSRDPALHKELEVIKNKVNKFTKASDSINDALSRGPKGPPAAPAAPVVPKIPPKQTPPAPVGKQAKMQFPEAPKAARPEKTMPMNFKDGDAGLKMRPENKGKSTMDLILEGKRTATSRSPQYQGIVEKGDVITFTDKQGRKVTVRATTGEYPLKDVTPEYWSKLEGWDKAAHARLAKQNYKQFRYEVIKGPAKEISAEQIKAAVAKAPPKKAPLPTGYEFSKDGKITKIGEAPPKKAPDVKVAREKAPLSKDYESREAQKIVDAFKREREIGTHLAKQEGGPTATELWNKASKKVQKKATEIYNKRGDKPVTVPKMKKKIEFEEDQSAYYTPRTRKNASADATIAIAADFTSRGEIATKREVMSQGKQYIPVDGNNFNVTPERVKIIVDGLNNVNAKSLNIAGNGIYTMKGKYTQAEVDAFTYKLLKAVTESPNLKNKIESVRTGGQTGFDEAGAKAAARLGIPTKILAPKGWKMRDVDGKDISGEAGFKNRFEVAPPAEKAPVAPEAPVVPKAPESKRVKTIKEALYKELPKEVADAVNVVDTMPEVPVGTKFSLQGSMVKKGIKDPIAVNWAIKNNKSVDMSKINSEADLRKAAEKQYEKKADKKQYKEIVESEEFSKNFDTWTESLSKEYPAYFRDSMIDIASSGLKRQTKFVPRASKVAINATFEHVQQNPGQQFNMRKLYREKMLKETSQSAEHEPSASGKGHWVKIERKTPKTIEVDVYYLFDKKQGVKVSFQMSTKEKAAEMLKGKNFALDGRSFGKHDTKRQSEVEIRSTKVKKEDPNDIEYKMRVELLRRISPETWCTKGRMAADYVRDYDNYVLIVDGKPVAGIEARPKEKLLDGKWTKEGVEAKKLRDVNNVTSINNNGVSTIDHMNDVFAFMKKHKLNTKDRAGSIKKALEEKKKGETDATVRERDEWVDHDPNDFARYEFEGGYAGEDGPPEPHNWMIAENRPREDWTQELAREAITEDPYTIQFVPEELITANMARRAVEAQPYAIRYIPERLITERMLTENINTQGPAVWSYDNIPERLRTKELFDKIYYDSKATREARNDTNSTNVAFTEHTINEKFITKDILLDVVKEGSTGDISAMPKKMMTQELSELAVKNKPTSIQNVPQEYVTSKMVEAAVDFKGWLLQSVPKNKITEKAALSSVRQDGGNLRYVPEVLKTEKVVMEAVKRGATGGLENPVLQAVPEKMMTNEVILEAVRSGGNAARYIPEKFMNEALAIKLVEVNPHTARFLPDNLKTWKVADAIMADKLNNRAIASFPREKVPTRWKKRYDEVYNLDLPSYIYASRKAGGKVQGFYDPSTDRATLVAKNLKPGEAAKVALHELTERGMVRVAREVGGTKEMHKILKSAEPELMKAQSELLARTGHKDLAELVADYGFDIKTPEGEVKLLSELAARWGERFTDQGVAPPNWWKKLMEGISQWVKQFMGKTLDKAGVDNLVSGFMRYGMAPPKPSVVPTAPKPRQYMTITKTIKKLQAMPKGEAKTSIGKEVGEIKQRMTKSRREYFSDLMKDKRDEFVKTQKDKVAEIKRKIKIEDDTLAREGEYTAGEKLWARKSKAELAKELKETSTTPTPEDAAKWEKTSKAEAERVYGHKEVKEKVSESLKWMKGYKNWVKQVESKIDVKVPVPFASEAQMATAKKMTTAMGDIKMKTAKEEYTNKMSDRYAERAIEKMDEVNTGKQGRGNLSVEAYAEKLISVIDTFEPGELRGRVGMTGKQKMTALTEVENRLKKAGKTPEEIAKGLADFRKQMKEKDLTLTSMEIESLKSDIEPRLTAHGAELIKRSFDAKAEAAFRGEPVEVARERQVKAINRMLRGTDPAVMFVKEPIVEDGAPVGGRLRYNKQEIKLHKKTLEGEYEEMIWTKPWVEGENPMKADAFKGFKQYVDFVIRREKARKAQIKKPSMSDGEYNNIINERAALGDKIFEKPPKKLTFEEQDALDKRIIALTKKNVKAEDVDLGRGKTYKIRELRDTLQETIKREHLKDTPAEGFSKTLDFILREGFLDQGMKNLGYDYASSEKIKGVRNFSYALDSLFSAKNKQITAELNRLGSEKLTEAGHPERQHKDLLGRQYKLLIKEGKDPRELTKEEKAWIEEPKRQMVEEKTKDREGDVVKSKKTEKDKAASREAEVSGSIRDVKDLSSLYVNDLSILDMIMQQSLISQAHVGAKSNARVGALDARSLGYRFYDIYMSTIGKKKGRGTFIDWVKVMDFIDTNFKYDANGKRIIEGESKVIPDAPKAKDSKVEAYEDYYGEERAAERLAKTKKE